MRKKIAFYIDTDTFGGLEHVLLQLMRGLDPDEWEPILLHRETARLAPLLDEARARGITAYGVAAAPGIAGIARLPAIIRVLRKERPDVFHAHLNWPMACTAGVIAAAIVGTPAIVATVHLIPKLLHTPLMRVIRKTIPRLVDRYVAVSEGVAQGLPREIALPPDRITVVRNGVQLPHADSASTQPQGEESAERFHVFTPARLELQKGHRYLIEAAAELPEAFFSLAGEGPLRNELENYARELGVAERMCFLGHRTDVPALLQECDVVVLPSLCEGLPLAVLEAMASGRPVVATDIPGTKEAVVNEVTGLLVPSRDSGALAAAIRRLMHDPHSARSFAAAGRERAMRHFSVTGMIEGTVAVYHNLLSRDASRHVPADN